MIDACFGYDIYAHVNIYISKGNAYNNIGFVRAGNTTTASWNMFSSDIKTNEFQDMTSGNSGNLQPYVVVKRWHRTA